MAAQWQRWLRYARAKLESSVREGEAELDRKEAELQARAEGKPWLSSSGDAPTLDEARARIEHQAREAEELRRRREAGGGEGTVRAPSDPTAPPTAPTGDRPPSPPPPAASPPLTTDPQLGSFDFAAQQRAADARLAAIRAELGLVPEQEPPAEGDGRDEREPDAADDDAADDGPAATDGSDDDGSDDDDGPDAPVAPI